jgi:hypothetical protein
MNGKKFRTLPLLSAVQHNDPDSERNLRQFLKIRLIPTTPRQLSRYAFPCRMFSVCRNPVSDPASAKTFAKIVRVLLSAYFFPYFFIHYIKTAAENKFHGC